MESLPKMIDEMDLKVKPNEAIKLENENYKIILKPNWKGEPTDKWIVSAYIKKEKGESISSTPFTKEDNLHLNSNAIIPHSKPFASTKANFTKEQWQAGDRGLERLEQSREVIKESLKPIKETLENLPATNIPQDISIDDFLNSLDNFQNKENFIAHLQSKPDAQSRLAYLNLVEPTFTKPDFKFSKFENGAQKEKRIKKFTDGKDFFYLLATKDNDKTLLTGFKTNKINTILKEFEGVRADIIQAFIRQGSKQEAWATKGNIIPHSKPFASANFTKEQWQVGDNEAFTQAIKEFGENYPQFYRKGSEAIEHLLQKRSGQVQGAFYREDLGDITLVWGDSKAGLEHILQRRTQDFLKLGFPQAQAEAKALEFIKSLPEIIQKGEIEKGSNRVFLNTNDKRAVVALDYKGEKNNWVVTAYINEPKANVSAYPHQNIQTLNTSSPIVEKPLNSNAIIPHSKPFASTKANFTKEQWQNLTTQEKIKAFKDQRAREKAQIAEASDYLKVKHAGRIDAKRNEKLLNRAKYPLVEAADSTHPLSTNSSRYMPTGANALSKDDGIIPQNAKLDKATQGRTQKQEAFNAINNIQKEVNESYSNGSNSGNNINDATLYRG